MEYFQLSFGWTEEKLLMFLKNEVLNIDIQCISTRENYALLLKIMLHLPSFMKLVKYATLWINFYRNHTNTSVLNT